jgi:predicted TIM-barrel fold metal-dependent hydrolase
MDRMDYEAEARPDQWPYAEPPSAVIRNGNVYVSCEPGERTLPTVVDLLGAGQILYASDFPHELGSGYEEYLEDLEEMDERADLSDEAKRGILADNADRFYQRVPVRA